MLKVLGEYLIFKKTSESRREWESEKTDGYLVCTAGNEKKHSSSGAERVRRRGSRHCSRQENERPEEEFYFPTRLNWIKKMNTE